MAIREAMKKINAYWQAGDLDSVMEMVSDDYFDRRCLDKAAVEESWGNFLDSISDYLQYTTLEDMEVVGDDAFVLREALEYYVDATSGNKDWNWSRELRRYRRENGEWKYYGAQLGFRPDWYDVYARHTSYDGQHYPIAADFIDCADNQYIDTPAPIAAFTVNGPPGSGLVNLDLMPYWYSDPRDPWRGFWNQESLTVCQTGFYTFRVENNYGDYFVYTDYLQGRKHMPLPLLVSPAADEVVSAGNVVPVWDPVSRAETYRVDMRYSEDGGTTWYGMPNIYTDGTRANVSVDPDTLYQWRVRARQFDRYGELDGESRSDWQQFSTGVGGIEISGSYLQYRTYSDPANNRYQGYLSFLNNGQPIEESDIAAIVLKDEDQNNITISQRIFDSLQYYYGGWNPDSEQVDFSGPYPDTGFAIRFPETTIFAKGYYTYEVTTSQGANLSQIRYFPGKLTLAVVDSDSMVSEWINADLKLSWTNPDPGGPFDQVRIFFISEENGTEIPLIIRLPNSAVEVTIPAYWINRVKQLSNTPTMSWQIQLRTFDSFTNNNYARSNSDAKPIAGWSN